MENYLVNLYIIFQLVFGLDGVRSFRILELNVPQLIDPRETMTLGCRYDMGTEELYSVKWYKDDEEFFRYTPRQQPHIMSFPVAGVHLVQIGTSSSCNVEQCRVQLTGLSTTHSSGSYRCEVSTEAPTFRVVFNAANLTVAVVGKREPRVEGFRSVYALNDLLHANCTAEPADPAPVLTWMLNGSPAPSSAVGPLRTSQMDVANGPKLLIAYRDLSFHVTKGNFLTPDGTLNVTCVAKPPPGVPAKALAKTVTARLHNPFAGNANQQRNVIGKLEWINSSVSARSLHQGLMFTIMSITFCWR